MKCSTVLVVVCAALAAASTSEGDERQSRLVPTAEGPVRGYKETNGVYSFHNIPYATAPTGPYRFMAPLAPALRLSTFDAIDRKIICPQGTVMMVNLALNNTMQEDCLVANIYVPDTEDKNLPVIVYVHGGGYQIGYGNLFTPKALVQTEKIIAVTFNYRIGAHGFLCLGTEDVPGNAGMKDQVALLRWVRRNIANFGGNPDDITISGYSAGSSAVDLLMLSESARGLFNKVIPESGANVGVWSVQLDPLENAKTYAKALNFSDIDDIYAIEEFYKTASFETLISGSSLLDNYNSNFLFSPCVERNTGREIFLKQAPVDILQQGKYPKVPILYGFANMEGLFRVPKFNAWKDKMNEKFSDFLPADLRFENEEQKEQVAKLIKEFYFGDKPVGKETTSGYINYFTDTMFAYPTLRAVKLHLDAGSDSIYLYEFSFVDDEFVEKQIHAPGFEELFKNIDLEAARGANHCAQTAAVLDDNVLGNLGKSDRVIKMRALIRTLWLNFITTGKPVPEGSSLPKWPPVSTNWSPHMSLNEKLELRGSLLLERARFWDAVYEKHYRTPAPPPPPPSHGRTEL